MTTGYEKSRIGQPDYHGPPADEEPEPAGACLECEGTGAAEDGGPCAACDGSGEAD